MSNTAVKRAGIILDDKNLSLMPPDQVRRAVFEKLKGAFSSGQPHDESYTTCASSDVNLLSVDFQVDPNDLEP